MSATHASLGSPNSLRLVIACIVDTSSHHSRPAGHLTCCKLLLEEGADIEQRNVVRRVCCALLAVLCNAVVCCAVC